MNDTNDLWGDLQINVERVPLTVFREQATLLTEKTNGILQGIVDTETQYYRLHVSFVIQVPALDDYRVLIARGKHSIESPYPVEVASRKEDWQTCADEPALAEVLGTILRSADVRKIVSALVSQSKATG